MRIARDLRKQFTKLQTADAIHIATALEARIPVFLTRDEPVLALNGKIRNPSPLEIIRPEAYFKQLRSESLQEEMKDLEQGLAKDRERREVRLEDED